MDTGQHLDSSHLIIWIGVVTTEEDPYADTSISDCLYDLDCIAKKYEEEGAKACRIAVEDAALWDYEWTGPRFNYIQLNTGSNFRMIGDSIKFQNQYGAWMHMNYICWYYPASKWAEVVVR